MLVKHAGLLSGFTAFLIQSLAAAAAGVLLLASFRPEVDGQSVEIEIIAFRGPIVRPRNLPSRAIARLFAPLAPFALVIDVLAPSSSVCRRHLPMAKRPIPLNNYPIGQIVEHATKRDNAGPPLWQALHRFFIVRKKRAGP